MSSMSKSKGCLFLASSLCDGLEDNNITQVTTLLLNKEADPNTLIPMYGVTPFHLVIGNDSEAFAEEVTKLFLRHGGNPNVKSIDGLTPVHVAAAWGRVAVLELLLANGGDAVCLDYEGRSPFHYAFDGKYYGAITMLGKYCENITKEVKPTKHKITFNKLLVNTGDMVAEYTAPLNTDKEDIWEEFQINEENRISDMRGNFYFSDNSINDDQADIKDAEHRLREEMDKEKCLLNQIINQLSNSLNSNSKEVDINNEYKQERDSRCDTSPLSVLNLNDHLVYDTQDKFSLKTKTKKRCVTPRYRRRILGQNNINKIPLSPLQNPSDPIISKSPNFLMGKTVEKEQRYLSPKILNRESKFKTYTPCMTRTGSFRSDEFNFGKEIARSTPRRKRFYRQYSSYRKIRKNDVLTSSENTSPDSTNSLSPDENRHPKSPYKFTKNISKNLAMKLYDDDVPISPHFNDKYKLKGLADELCDLENLDIKESVCFGRKTDSLKVNESFQEKYLEELKSNDTSNSFRENYNVLSSSFKSQSFISVQEEYRYDDSEENIAFLERRIYTIPPCESGEDFVMTNVSWPQRLNLSMDLFISNEELRRKLINLGERPGPIINTTKQLYLKRLIRLETELKQSCDRTILPSAYSYRDNSNFEIKSSLTYGNWVDNLGRYKIIEKTVFKEFCSVDPSRKWREGLNKTCFNYLLLDPRVTRDLPSRAETMTKSEVWTTFLSAIFYVGKGTRNRPYSHLKDAFEAWVSTESSDNAKVQKILNIWNAGYGVVCLHVFQNVIPVEAYTREAAMIDALGIKLLKNCKNGDYYGIAATWCTKEKCNFGRYLLHQAMQIFLHEGERQILPHNL
ncbi:uncharacterized protein LOC143358786 [Halictus rubicundus]|uniref:uncharacterized protein LOC143358786 n=1 Tax=Halictus rubicundus TaxID=77578 RepID=UPI004035D04C